MPGIVSARLNPEQLGAKRATAQLIRAVGGIEAAAEFCRIGKSQLADCASVNCPDRWMPIDVAIDLEAVTIGTTGAPILTRYLARRAGFALFELPAADVGPIDWHAMLAAQIKEGGDVMQAIALRADKPLTAAIIQECRLIDEIDEAIWSLVNMRAAAVGIVSESG